MPSSDLSPKPGNKIIHLIRHAEGQHNLSPAYHNILDPSLTPFGESQCAAFASAFPAEHVASIQLLVASPLSRTLQTALRCFPTLVAGGEAGATGSGTASGTASGSDNANANANANAKPGLKILALPSAQECGLLPCDTGRAPSALKAPFAGQPVDLSLVHDGWDSKTGFYGGDVAALEKRAASVRAWLREREERVIVLVTHGAFLHYLTRDWEGFDPARGTAWANCEWRSFEFQTEGNGEDLGKGDGDVGLVETQASRVRRGGRVVGGFPRESQGRKLGVEGEDGKEVEEGTAKQIAKEGGVL